mmetsp:Transcript_3079/g.3890  ORF Transcript_3079/g.3890 Transcript_3079/m.3890 type:complete len:678 (+) Transcript_3079:221-2254(+)|eukprot:CAMPEP_0204830916 /NCGR_PEP_ID=MMETSP1346-20131115/9485_1 /ASSEMBLY_ACC=CAM_ASM_000771 /TAXON_ID=215587 /ORGANISM="Aplanochytrium stocchinoi, Strain GSBS06" /LENGTH=677 /DNA_ID=CAMNT_0051961529 /DNA_START=161 /DNA_END=2194 /DNA_ORIENTATION=+
MLAKTLLVCLTLGVAVKGFYLPGVAPRDYKYGETVDLKVNKLTSSKTQLPYDFYKLPFCQPEKIESAAENLGEVLTGNIIENSAYDLKFLVEEKCKVLCRKEYGKEDVDKFVEKIKEYYVVNWIVDNLPSALYVPMDNFETEYYQGFPVGGTMIDEKTGEVVQHFLNNHQRIIVKYHVHKRTMFQEEIDDFTLDEETGFEHEEISARIVGLDIEPFSVKHTYEGKWDDQDPPELSSCQGIRHESLTSYVQALDSEAFANPTGEKKKKGAAAEKKLEVIWTYEVYWEPSSIKWATRWDVYLNGNNSANDEVHWFAIINSLLIVVFLTGMVAMIMMRTLHKDMTRYNRIPTEEEKAEEREETGWKLVHGDVFRAPAYPMLFAVTVGTGTQVLSMAFFTLVFASIGFLSPANRGSLMIALLLLFVLMGVFAGYHASRTYKMFNGKQWQRCTLLTAFFYPSLVFTLIFFLNLFVWAEGSSSAIPFFSMISVLMLWFGISVPLTFLGAYYGYRKDVDKQPVKTQDIPRQIPEQPWYMSAPLTILMGGVLPFGAVFVELFFILSSLWLDQYYYVFGFLLLVFIILCVTCAEITIVLCYFQLCGEDYHWWWRSFLTSGSSAMYLFFYSIVYYSGRLQIDLWVSTILYFGYMALVSLMFFLASGVIGYLSCKWFIYKIYSSVKVD